MSSRCVEKVNDISRPLSFGFTLEFTSYRERFPIDQDRRQSVFFYNEYETQKNIILPLLPQGLNGNMRPKVCLIVHFLLNFWVMDILTITEDAYS